jgi:hypothetical protein
MNYLFNAFLDLVKDSNMFFLIQACLVLLFFVSMINNFSANRRALKGRGVTITLSVTRGDESMAKFYGAYLAINGVLIAICLSVETAKDYRIFWVVVDSFIPAYLCILNPWSRNKLLGWVNAVTKLESR